MSPLEQIFELNHLEQQAQLVPLDAEAERRLTRLQARFADDAAMSAGTHAIGPLAISICAQGMSAASCDLLFARGMKLTLKSSDGAGSGVWAVPKQRVPAVGSRVVVHVEVDQTQRWYDFPALVEATSGRKSFVVRFEGLPSTGALFGVAHSR